VCRIDRASRELDATPDRVYDALLDPDALLSWLPPAGMTGRFEPYVVRTGGGYRLVLTYAGTGASPGKTTDDADAVEATFVELVPEERVVQAVQFDSDDPAYAGTMTMTWTLEPRGTTTVVEIRAEDVPPGISPDDHQVGLDSTLGNLAAYLSD
jgi:uncharacterized protein YndB with AHSA1/START domain